MNTLERSASFASKLEPFATLVQVVAIVIASVFAIVQLRASNHEAKIGNTLSFLADVQTPHFQDYYLDSIRWLETSIRGHSAREPPCQDIKRKLTVVLNRYEALWVLYEREILDRETTEAAIGIQVAQLWLLSRSVLSKEELRGYENMPNLWMALDRSPAVCQSPSYINLKNEIQKWENSQ